jgi:flagellin
MGLTAASNIQSLRAARQVSLSTAALSDTFERLSSGLRINSASDDPAGLAVAEQLRSSASIAGVAIRNANDGLSITAVADSALSSIADVLVRMSELAEQAANGTFTNVQRSALSSEFLALGSEVERISRTTTFNNVSLLSGSANITLQVGLDSSANSQITIQSVIGTLSSLGIGTVAGALSYSLTGTTSDFAATAALNALSAVTTAIDTISRVRGVVGANQSRLEVAVNNLAAARENFLLAESRIRDADVALETSQMLRLQILQQAGTAVLAQANQQPALVLGLLQ